MHNVEVAEAVTALVEAVTLRLEREEARRLARPFRGAAARRIAAMGTGGIEDTAGMGTAGSGTACTAVFISALGTLASTARGVIPGTAIRGTAIRGTATQITAI